MQWEPEVAAEWLKTDPTMLAHAAEEAKSAVEAAVADAAANPFRDYLDPATNKFTYEVLKSSFPDGVPPTKKEYYLSDEEFTQYLKMSKDEWESLKQWKKD